MTKWKKDTKEFEVSVHYSKENKGINVNMPKPILERLGNPLKLKFIIKNEKIMVEV